MTKRHFFFYQIFDPQDFKRFFETFLQNNMAPQIKLQTLSLLVYNMQEQFEKVKSDGRTDETESQQYTRTFFYLLAR